MTKKLRKQGLTGLGLSMLLLLYSQLPLFAENKSNTVKDDTKTESPFKEYLKGKGSIDDHLKKARREGKGIEVSKGIALMPLYTVRNLAISMPAALFYTNVKGTYHFLNMENREANWLLQIGKVPAFPFAYLYKLGEKGVKRLINHPVQTIIDAGVIYLIINSTSSSGSSNSSSPQEGGGGP